MAVTGQLSSLLPTILGRPTARENRQRHIILIFWEGHTLPSQTLPMQERYFAVRDGHPMAVTGQLSSLLSAILGRPTA